MTKDELRRIRRKTLELSQLELSHALGITSKTVSNYERGIQHIPILFELAVLYLVMQCAKEEM